MKTKPPEESLAVELDHAEAAYTSRRVDEHNAWVLRTSDRRKAQEALLTKQERLKLDAGDLRFYVRRARKAEIKLRVRQYDALREAVRMVVTDSHSGALGSETWAALKKATKEGGK